MPALDCRSCEIPMLKEHRDASLGRPRRRLYVRRVGKTAELRPRRVSQRVRAMQNKQSTPSLPNQALEPTITAVTPRADARVAPAVIVAHL